ncbi:SpoIIE family protein phosphatase [Pseudohalioglobus lutimaris]|uniref:Regulator n=1 Tax=Pseudohalioglobus lutimaris TaxID=1737061 RepID=A0A2N5X924_9GAMM|nr:SpoIIE family protein phosphatase [Pseudohalioglobus lutimaris]PLW70992.1 regulator [Pseudohalioglobus lutimaris]
MSNSISTRLITVLTAAAALIISAGMLLDYRVSREEILQRLTEQAVAETRVVISDMESWLNSVEATTRLLASILEQRQYSEAGLQQMLRDVVSNNNQIFGAAIAVIPGSAEGNEGFAPYFYVRDGQIHFADLTSDQASYTEQAWFTEPLSRREAVWSEPYFDKGGGEVNMTTFSVPVYRKDETGASYPYAVVTADVTLAAINTAMQQLHLGASSYGLLFSRKGILMSSRSGQNVMKHYSELHFKGLDLDGWRLMFQRALRGETSTRDFPCADNSGRCTIRLGRLGITGWPVGVGYHQNEVLSPLHHFELKTAAISAITLLLVVLAVYALISRLTRPLSELTRATEDMARGNLDTPLPRASGEDEVARLVRSFSSMNRDLKSYIADLESVTASRSRLEGELAAARDIQMSMLPEGGEALLNVENITLWAKVAPARTVGGDLYTYYRDGDQLFLAVGDVSDKGVPAALFMARAISLIQQLAGTATPPHQAMTELNNALERDNHSCMFVTLFLGVLDLRTGRLRFASAGHTAPALLREGGVSVQNQATGPALGLVPDQLYPDNSLQLQNGDRLAIYTDGIDEAFNERAEMFGSERFNRALLASAHLSTAQAGQSLFTAVTDFAGKQPQSDDITLMLLDYAWPAAASATGRFTLGDTLTGHVHGWMEPVLADWELAETFKTELTLVAEEIVSNIQKYAGLADDAHIELLMERHHDKLVLEVRDPGLAFNPLREARRSTLGEDIESAEIGGLGVHLITQFTDRQHYHHEDGINVLRVEKDRPPKLDGHS